MVVMASTDTFNVVGSWDKASYKAGDTITGTISGDDVQTVTTVSKVTVGPVVVPITAADGATSEVTFPATSVDVPTTTTTSQSVVIDTSQPIVDNGPKPRKWVVSTNKLSITATA